MITSDNFRRLVATRRAGVHVALILFEISPFWKVRHQGSTRQVRKFIYRYTSRRTRSLADVTSTRSIITIHQVTRKTRRRPLYCVKFVYDCHLSNELRNTAPRRVTDHAETTEYTTRPDVIVVRFGGLF